MINISVNIINYSHFTYTAVDTTTLTVFLVNKLIDTDYWQLVIVILYIHIKYLLWNGGWQHY